MMTEEQSYDARPQRLTVQARPQRLSATTSNPTTTPPQRAQATKEERANAERLSGHAARCLYCAMVAPTDKEKLKALRALHYVLGRWIKMLEAK